MPTDFIFPLKGLPIQTQHPEVLANMLAQSEVFARGYQSEDGDPQKTIQGNVPHNLILLDALTPACLGALIAAYEHMVFVQSVVWGINAYDQWGVQRGKVVAASILQQLQSVKPNAQPSSLIDFIAKEMRDEAN